MTAELPATRRSQLFRPMTWPWYRLFEPVDAASVALFRIVFGALMVWEVYRYFETNWIKIYFISPKFFFRFEWFEWLPAPSATVAYALWILTGIGAAAFCIGFYTRVGALLMTVPFTYFFLLDTSNYLNHFYLICLLGTLCVFLPTGNVWSIDVRRTEGPYTIPCWVLWMLRIQVGIPYFFGGIAKLFDRDWLLGIPMQHMLFPSFDVPIIGRYVAEWWVADFFAFGGMFFDLLVVPLLIWKRTRKWAFLTVLAFNLTNKFFLNIGIFPWMMIGATTLFFDPDWPRRIPWIGKFHSPKPGQHTTGFSLSTRQKLTTFLAGLWMLIQFTVPFRHYFYEGNSNWTEQGHRFSWRMKLRGKSCFLTYYLVDPKTGEVFEFDHSPYLMARQARDMPQHPVMILQFTHFLREQIDAIGFEHYEIRVEDWCSLNNREEQQLINPELDLSRYENDRIMPDWILPLEEPLGPRQKRAAEVIRDLRSRLPKPGPAAPPKSSPPDGE